MIIQLITTVLGSLGAIFAAAAILQNMDKRITHLLQMASTCPNPQTAAYFTGLAVALKTKRWIIAGVFIAGVTVANGFLFTAAKNFASNYGSMGGTWIASAAQIVAPILVGAAVQTAIEPRWSKFFDKVWGNFSGSLTNLGLGIFK